MTQSPKPEITPGKGAPKPEFSEKRRERVAIKTGDGQIILGEIYLNKLTNRVKDGVEVWGTHEPFIAITNVEEIEGTISSDLILLNSETVIFVATSDMPLRPLKSGESNYISKKKVRVTIKLSDGYYMEGNVFMRTTVDRLKDDINAKEVKFVAVTDVHGEEGLTYLVNKRHITYIVLHDSA